MGDGLTLSANDERRAEVLNRVLAGMISPGPGSGRFLWPSSSSLLAWWLPAPRRVRFVVVALLAVLALLNGAANIYEGVHWPSGALGGYLWAGVLLAAWWWFRHLTLAALHLMGRRRDTPTS